MSDPDSRLRATAYHEAGHAVVAFRLMRSARRVSVVAGFDPRIGPTLGGVPRNRPMFTGPWPENADDLDPRQTKRIEDEIVVSYAGAAAEERHRGGVDEEVVRGAEIDLADLHYWLTLLGIELDAWKPYTARLNARAEQLIDEHWPEVVALAAVLVAEGKTSSWRTREVITGAAQGAAVRRQG